MIAVPALPPVAAATFERRETSNDSGHFEKIIAVSTVGHSVVLVGYVAGDTVQPGYEFTFEKCELDSAFIAAERNLKALVASIKAGTALAVPSDQEVDELARIIARRGGPADREAWARRLAQDTADLVD